MGVGRDVGGVGEEVGEGCDGVGVGEGHEGWEDWGLGVGVWGEVVGEVEVGGLGLGDVGEWCGELEHGGWGVGVGEEEWAGCGGWGLGCGGGGGGGGCGGGGCGGGDMDLWEEVAECGEVVSVGEKEDGGSGWVEWRAGGAERDMGWCGGVGSGGCSGGGGLWGG